MARKQENNLPEKEGNYKNNSLTLNQIIKYYNRLVSFVGFEVLKVIKNIYDGERRLSKITAARLGPGMEQFCSRVSEAFRRAGSTITRPFRTVAHGFVLMGQSASAARKDGRPVVPAVMGTFCAGVKNNRWFFKGLLNYGAAAFGIAAVVTVVGVMTNLNFAVAVEYDGEKLGYIESEEVYETASKMLQQRIVSETDKPELATPKFTLAVVDSSELATEDELVDSMIRSASADIVESNGIYIDGEFYGAVADTAEIEKAVDALLAEYTTGAENETVALVKPVEIKEGLYLTDSVVDAQSIVTLLNSEVAGEVTYTVQAGDTPSGVASAHDVPYSDFKAMNPDCETNFLIGKVVYLAKSEPFMPVQVTRRVTYQEEVMFETETVNDSSKSISYTKVTQNGQKGINEVTADVQYVNGVETERTVVSTKVLQNVVNQKIVKGTKQPSNASAAAMSMGGSSLGNLHFMWPVNGGEISSYFGARWGSYHSGLDIRAPKGTEVYAAESGTVTMSKWNGAYGYCVMIDHGNGIKTLYGHASKLIAKVGQKVDKGDVIMLVGTTGRSTGNHCHFEIQKNGTRINPLPYIGS